jgi:aspartate racemase
MFAFQDAAPSTFTLPGLSVTSLDVDPGTAKFDLTLYADGGAEGLRATLEYNSDLFEARTISRMLGHLRTLLEGIAADPGRRLSELPLLTEGERHQLLVEWNDTVAEYPRDACIHHLFEAQAHRAPDAMAAVFNESSLTYRG